jgi:hypothetical protein
MNLTDILLESQFFDNNFFRLEESLKSSVED